MSMGLTQRQSELLDFISAHLFAYGVGPSLNEVATAMGWRSKSSAHHAIRALAARGYIRLDGHRIELIQSIGHDPRDCSCDGCNRVRIRAHQTFIQALQVPAPMLGGTNFKSLGIFTQTCWRIGFPKPAHPETRKPQSNVKPAQGGK